MKKLIIISVLCCLCGVIQSNAQNLETLFIQNKYDDILKEVKTKMDAGTTTANDYFWAAQVHRSNKNHPNAIHILKLGIDSYPQDTSILLLLGDTYFEAGDYTNASSLLESMTFDRNSQMNLAKIHEFYTQHQKAIDIYNKILEKDSTNQFILKSIGHNYYRLDSFQLAADYLEKSLEIYGSNMNSLFILSKTYEKMEEHKKSIEVCDTALAKDPNNPIFLKQAGREYFQLKNYRKADNYLNQCMTLGDTSLFIQKLLGICKFQIKQMGPAENLLLKAYEKDNENLEVCYYLARVYNEMLDAEKSRKFLLKAEEIMQPSDEMVIAILVERVNIRKGFGEFKELMTDYQKLYELTDDPQYIYYQGSTAQFYLKNDKAAMKYYQNYLELVNNISDDEEEKDQEQTVSIKTVAEKNLKKLKEKLFFEGKLEKSDL